MGLLGGPSTSPLDGGDSVALVGSLARVVVKCLFGAVLVVFGASFLATYISRLQASAKPWRFAWFALAVGLGVTAVGICYLIAPLMRIWKKSGDTSSRND